jgi:hypothetical protein
VLTDGLFGRQNPIQQAHAPGFSVGSSTARGFRSFCTRKGLGLLARRRRAPGYPQNKQQEQQVMAVGGDLCVQPGLLGRYSSRGDVLCEGETPSTVKHPSCGPRGGANIRHWHAEALCKRNRRRKQTHEPRRGNAGENGREAALPPV